LFTALKKYIKFITKNHLSVGPMLPPNNEQAAGENINQVSLYVTDMSYGIDLFNTPIVENQQLPRSE